MERVLRGLSIVFPRRDGWKRASIARVSMEWEKKKKKRKKEKGRRSETRVNSSSINLGFVFFRVANTVASKERLNIARLHRHRGGIVVRGRRFVDDSFIEETILHRWRNVFERIILTTTGRFLLFPFVVATRLVSEGSIPTFLSRWTNREIQR